MTEMLSALSLKKALRAVMFFLACLLMTGCYSLKSVSVRNIPPERKILVVHAEENFWTVDSYSVTEGMLTGHIGTGDLKVKKGNSAHIYVAPSTVVTVEGETLTLPIVNIAKADYHDINPGESIGFGVIWASLFFTLMLFLG